MKQVFLLVLLFNLWVFTIAQPVTVLQHVHIIDGTGKALQRDHALVIKDGVITGISSGKITIPPGAAVVDMKGKYLMPTIINTHGHLGILKDTTIAAANYTSDNIRRQLLHYQQYGVSAVLSMGTEHALI